MKQPEPLRVTEHAVIRYLERAMGMDIEMIRQHIATICAGPAALGAVCVRSEGLRFEIVNGVVVTVAPDGALPNKTSRERAQRKMRATA